MFASSGERGEPCGMPRRWSRASVVRVFRPRSSVSSTGHSSHRPYTAEEAKDPTIAVIGGRDREAFPEFYGEYDARVLANARPAGRAIVTGAITYTGTAELQRDIANLKAGLAKVKGVTGFLPVLPKTSIGSPEPLQLRLCSEEGS